MFPLFIYSYFSAGNISKCIRKTFCCELSFDEVSADDAMLDSEALPVDALPFVLFDEEQAENIDIANTAINIAVNFFNLFIILLLVI